MAITRRSVGRDLDAVATLVAMQPHFTDLLGEFRMGSTTLSFYNMMYL